MKLKEALKIAQNRLQDHSDEALFFLCEFLQKEKSFVFLNPDFEFDEKPYFLLIDRFINGEPFEYIFKKVDFYGYEFNIEEGVLIPRFDSEILLEIILKEIKKNKYVNILEIGFGSGVLSILVAKLLQVKITACDINKKAFDLAKKNAKVHGVCDLIDFQLCDFRKLEAKFDFIFSNPPYIEQSYPLDIWVKSEPKDALFGGEKGWEILEDIIEFSKKNKTKTLACEFAYNQKEILHKILHKNNFTAEFFKDLNGYDRAFLAFNSD